MNQQQEENLKKALKDNPHKQRKPGVVLETEFERKAVASFKERLKQKVNAEISELKEERRTAREGGHTDVAFQMTERILEAQTIKKLIDETE